LTPEQDEFVDQIVRAGEYHDASEAIRDAVRALQQRRREDELKLAALRSLIRVGTDAVEKGNFVDLDEADLDEYLASLAISVTDPG
jgi:antitoxin ParD1/3/4